MRSSMLPIKERNEWVREHIGLLRRLAGYYGRSGLVSRDDLVQEAFLAVVRAAELYDPEKEVSFTYYAMMWVKSRMQRAVHREWAHRHPYIAGGRVVMPGTPTRQLARHPMCWLNHPAYNEPGSGELADTLGAPATQEEQVLAGEVRALLRGVVAEEKDWRVQVIVDARFRGEETLKAAGKRVGLSREGVRLLLAEVTSDLKKRTALQEIR